MSNRPSKAEQAINEMMTRRKSAQQKRQLRNIDRSMKRITELLRSPTKKDDTKKTKMSPKKYNNKFKVAKSTDTNNTQIHNLTMSPSKLKVRKRLLSNKSSAKKENLVASNTEFYPKTVKRNCEVKKVLLKPNHKLQLIGKTNKRKWSIPNKGYKVQESDTNMDMLPELSFLELIRYKEETEEMTDDDLMEILTCPSPVWWEEPLDEEYCEDAIGCRTPEPVLDLTSETSPPKNLNVTKIDLGNKDEKFIKKRSKLEHVLGNMKSKRLGKDDNCSVVVANKEVELKRAEKTKKKDDNGSGVNEMVDEIIENTAKIPVNDRKHGVGTINDKVIENTEIVAQSDQNRICKATDKVIEETCDNVKGHTEANNVDIKLTTVNETKGKDPKKTGTESNKSDNKKRETFTKLAQAYKDLLKDKVKIDSPPREQKTSDSLVPDEDTLINFTTTNTPAATEHTEIESETKSFYPKNDNKQSSKKIVKCYKNCNKKPKKKDVQQGTDIFTVLKDLKYVGDNVVSNENKTELVFCELCPKRYKKVYLRDNSTVNYCMSCSSIFDTQDCSYCESIREKTDHDCNACRQCSSGHFESLRYCGSVEKRGNFYLTKI